MGSGRYFRIRAVKKEVLRTLEDNTATSTRVIEHLLIVSSLRRILIEEETHLYHLQRVKALKLTKIHSNVWQLPSHNFFWLSNYTKYW